MAQRAALDSAPTRSTEPPEPEVLRLLKAYGVRQQDLANKFGFSKVVVSRWAHGTKPIPAYHLADLWELCDLARSAQAAGRSVQDALIPWYPTHLVWRNPRGEQLVTRTWNVPSTPMPDPALLSAPEGGSWALLQDAWTLVSTTLPPLIHGAHAGAAAPSSATLQTLRHLFEMGLVAVSSIQEARARTPLAPEGDPTC
jgi:transcriptional regulator with XRE-family HTH domain